MIPDKGRICPKPLRIMGYLSTMYVHLIWYHVSSDSYSHKSQNGHISFLNQDLCRNRDAAKEGGRKRGSRWGLDNVMTSFYSVSSDGGSKPGWRGKQYPGGNVARRKVASDGGGATTTREKEDGAHNRCCCGRERAHALIWVTDLVVSETLHTSHDL